MASTPSIKGSVFAQVVEDVNKVRSGDRLAPGELERWLQPADLALLSESILVSDWYPIGAYARMNEMLREVVGGGSNEYLRDQGRQTARRLLQAGLYQQLEYLQRAQVARTAEPSQRAAAFGRDLRLLTTLSSSILNFSRWEVKADDMHASRYVIEVADALEFPEVLAWRSDGFVNQMATVHGDPDLWVWRREARDRIVFRMIRDI